MNAQQGTVAVTGAFSYTGKYIALELLKAGRRVITLTRNPERPHVLKARIPAFRLDFTQPDELRKALSGVEVLVNTYWVRYNYPGSSFEQAVANTKILLDAAVSAGVRRVVHISVSKPDRTQLPYFRGKLQTEELVQASGLSYAIIRPTVVFGEEEVLINNITWLLRKMPVFTVPGDGRYQLQPVHVGDVAKLAAQAAASNQNVVLDAAGPQIFTFIELLELLKSIAGSRCLLVRVPAPLALGLSRILGRVFGDLMLTKEEMDALMENLLVVGPNPTGATRFSDWARDNAGLLGKQYVNELKRHHGKT
jgi:NADH dehydrogenase